MDTVAKIMTYAQDIVIFLTALLALDNAVDAIAKTFGNKKIDTICGVWALKLNALIEKFKITAQAKQPEGKQ